jgi:NADPH:quinone reductase-like Zn-dependent oxidoreductase
MFIQGRYRYKPEFPQTAGLEGAGIIEAVGENVNQNTGVLAAFFSRKAWAEYIVIPEEEFVVLPGEFPPDKAAQFCLNPFTAWGLMEESQTKAGDWLVLTAGNSAVSKIIIQLAKLRNINTIAVIRDMHQAEELKALGAAETLTIEDDNFTEKVKSLTEGKGINASLEAVGGKTGTVILENMAPFGRIIIYGLLDSNPVQFYNSQIIFNNISIKGFGVRGYLQNQSKQQRENMIHELINEIGKPTFQLPVEQPYRLNQFNEALKQYEYSNKKGKIIFKP